MALSRRKLLYSAAAALGAGCAAPAQALGDTEGAKSGLVTGVPRPLKYRDVTGFLSEDQIRWHHSSHYSGALKAFVSLDKGEAPGKHKTRLSKMNSVVLHELYFDGMSGKGSDPGNDANAVLKKRFGSLDRWIEDFKSAALSCQGWAVLAYHPINGKLYNIASDAHDEGPAWFGVPLVVLDMYEHSYYIDFQNNKRDYVKGFFGHVDWSEIERRLHDTRR